MQTILKKVKLKNNSQICLLIDFYIGFDSKDYINKLPSILEDTTELTYSITSYQVDGESLGIYPENLSIHSSSKITVSELIDILKEEGSSLQKEDLNHDLLKSLYDGNLSLESKEKIKQFL